MTGNCAVLENSLRIEVFVPFDAGSVDGRDLDAGFDAALADVVGIDDQRAGEVFEGAGGLGHEVADAKVDRGMGGVDAVGFRMGVAGEGDEEAECDAEEAAVGHEWICVGGDPVALCQRALAWWALDEFREVFFVALNCDNIDLVAFSPQFEGLSANFKELRLR